MTGARRTLAGATLLAAGAALLAPAAQAVPAGSDSVSRDLYLVVLDGAGTAAYDEAPSAARMGARLRAHQQRVLDAAGVDETVHRWTTALNGFAAELSPLQLSQLARMPGVASIESNRIRPLAGTGPARTAAGARPAPAADTAGGRGTVVGVVDSGIDPEGPVFADTRRLGPVPADFGGTCPDAEEWTDACTGKVVSARHFVEGFSPDRLSSGAARSPYDVHGHGTQVASLAAGNGGVSADTGTDDLGTFSGAAPDARIAVYKACWTAPDPTDDGCATVDLVSAIDQAVADRVDVLTLAVAGTPGLDAVDRALLGAAEADVVVAAAAGDAPDPAGHDQPWMLTVGASDGPQRHGVLELADGTELTGTMTATRAVGPVPVVAAASIPAPGWTTGDASLCLPGSLDAGSAAGRIVVCERGRIARVDKSSAVALADGAGMVLVNQPGRDPGVDLHAVPSLHVSADEGARLRDRLASGVRGTLRPDPVSTAPPAAMSWSAGGAADSSTVKPDVLAPGRGILAATTGDDGAGGWELLTGTSASAATVAGAAARIRADHPAWPAAWVRSVLTTGATSAVGDPSSLRQGAGEVRTPMSARTRLVYDVSPRAWRDALESGADLQSLNSPSVLVDDSPRRAVVTRRVTNVAGRHLYYSSAASGFASHDVQVEPAALRIPPGATRTFRITVDRVAGTAPRQDSGWVAWRGADGTRVRIPVVVRQGTP